MFNPNLKNVVIASAVAVFAGVSTFGINAVMSATTTTTPGFEAPTQSPEDARLVSPTFDNINVKTTIYNSAAGGVRINDALEVVGAISNPSGNVNINDDVILGKSDGTSTISLRGQFDFLGNYPTLSNIAEIRNMGDQDLWLNVGAAVLKLKQEGDIEIAGSVGGSGGNPLTLKSATIATALTLTNNGNNNVSGTTAWGQIKIGTEGGQQLLIDRNSIDAHKGNLAINSFGGNDVVVGTPSAPSDVTINGKLTAKSFGTYTRETSAFAAIDPNSIYETSVACPAATQLISCGAQGSDSTNYTPTKSVTFSNIDPYITTNTCYARGINTSAVKKYVRAIAVCLNPAI